MYEHVRACFAILYAICANVFWHAGAIALCLPATTSIASTLNLTLLVGGFSRERFRVMYSERGGGGLKGLREGRVGDFYDIGGIDAGGIVGLHEERRYIGRSGRGREVKIVDRVSISSALNKTHTE